jgi:hypothetical protein
LTALAPNGGILVGVNDSNRRYRIGDAERDQAAEFLREHHAQGRLDVAEFDERITAALNAKTQADLDSLFFDLPAPSPRSPGAGVAPIAASTAVDRPEVMTQKTRNTVDVMVGLLWPITIAVCFLIGWEYWWLLFAPFVASSIWENRKKQDKAELERWEKKQELGPGGDAG